MCLCSKICQMCFLPGESVLGAGCSKQRYKAREYIAGWQPAATAEDLRLRLLKGEGCIKVHLKPHAIHLHNSASLINLNLSMQIFALDPCLEN